MNAPPGKLPKDWLKPRGVTREGIRISNWGYPPYDCLLLPPLIGELNHAEQQWQRGLSGSGYGSTSTPPKLFVSPMQYERILSLMRSSGRSDKWNAHDQRILGMRMWVEEFAVEDVRTPGQRTDHQLHRADLITFIGTDPRWMKHKRIDNLPKHEPVDDSYPLDPDHDVRKFYLSNQDTEWLEYLFRQKCKTFTNWHWTPLPEEGGDGVTRYEGLRYRIQQRWAMGDEYQQRANAMEARRAMMEATIRIGGIARGTEGLGIAAQRARRELEVLAAERLVEQPKIITPKLIRGSWDHKVGR